MNLDISAPQFIIPENFCDANSSMVVLDLGNLRFHNSAPKPESTTPGESTDEDQTSEGMKNHISQIEERSLFWNDKDV